MPNKILIIEDEELLAHLLEKKLKQLGYEVYVAEDGEKGMQFIKDLVPDLVLLDLVLPKKGGFEILEELQQDPALKAIPVIIISNSGQPVELDKAKQLGARDWLIKTEFDPQEVIEKVAKVCPI